MVSGLNLTIRERPRGASVCASLPLTDRYFARTKSDF
jgi:hypothetical protein